MQSKIYWKLDVQNGPVREWSLSTENQEYNAPRIKILQMNWQSVATEDTLGDLFSWSMAFRK